MDFKLPELGEGVYEAEVVRWLVKPGDAVRRAQPLLEVLTDKATMEVPSPFAGTVSELKAEAGQVLKIGEVLLSYSEKGGAAPDKEIALAKEPKPAPVSDKEPVPAKESKHAPSSAKEPVTPVAHAPGSPIRSNGPVTAVKAAPSVRLMARKLGVDLGHIRGSGPDGRVLIDDLASSFSRAPTASADKVPPIDYGTPGTRIKLHGIRRKIAEHMVVAKQTIPHYTYVDECDVTDLVRTRTSLKEHFASKDVRITYLAFFVKAAVAALKEIPLVNSSLDDKAGEIVLHDRYNIGIAVATPSGLLVPVVQEADRKDFVKLAQEIERLSEEARAGKLRLEDLRGATFTITSIGNIGGLFATPIIPHPQAAILGVGKIVKRPVFDDRGQVQAADMVYLSFSFDHRILDGAIGAAFGNALIRQLKSPAALLL